MSNNTGYAEDSPDYKVNKTKGKYEVTNKMSRKEVNTDVEATQTQQEESHRFAIMRDRKKLQQLLHSHKFQMGIISLVVIDFLIVLVQLLIDVEVIKGVHHDHTAIKVLHIISIVVLGIFLVEIMVKIYAFRMDFFHHRLEVFDAVVVVVSFGLDVAYSGNADAWDAVGLLVLLRLWRIVRIANGIILSVKIEMDEKITHLKAEKHTLEQEVEEYKNKCTEQEKQILELEAKLQTS